MQHILEPGSTGGLIQWANRWAEKPTNVDGYDIPPCTAPECPEHLLSVHFIFSVSAHQPKTPRAT